MRMSIQGVMIEAMCLMRFFEALKRRSSGMKKRQVYLWKLYPPRPKGQESDLDRPVGSLKERRFISIPMCAFSRKNSMSSKSFLTDGLILTDLLFDASLWS